MLLIVAVSFRPRAAVAQPRLEMEQQLGCTGNEILVPINAYNLGDVGSFSIFIEVDTAGVDFVATENLFQGLLTGNLVSSITYENQPIIVINWFSMVPINLESGKLLDIRLKVKGQNSSLSFASTCELTKSDLSVIPEVVYSNGSITPLVALQPTPQAIKVAESHSVTFTLPTLENVTYQWQILNGDSWNDLSGPNYLGTSEASLTINAVSSAPLDQYYRCRIGLPNCIGYSGISSLKVSLLGESNVSPANKLMKVQALPAQQAIRIEFPVRLDGELTLIVCAVDGKVIKNACVENTERLCVISTNGWSRGLYMISLYKGDSAMQTQKVVIL